MKRIVFPLVVLLLTSGVVLGCGGSTVTDTPPRAPRSDYPPPAPETANGEPIGADRVPPGDKLATSPRIGSGGLVPAAQPVHGEPKTSPPAKPGSAPLQPSK